MIEVREYHSATRIDVLDLIPEKAGKVLDVGGGVGATCGFLRTQGRATFAALADRVEGPTAAGVDHVLRGDLEDPDFLESFTTNEPFDTILCLDVLEHLRDPWMVVKALDRALAPGGVLVASIPNVNYIGLVGPLVLQGRYELTDAGILDRTHIRWFTKAGAIELLTSSGLTLEQVFERIPEGRWSVANALTFGALKRFFVLQNCIRVKKPV